LNFRRRRPKLRGDWREKDTCYKVGRRRVMDLKRRVPFIERNPDIKVHT
jgi:hypothetical protein